MNKLTIPEKIKAIRNKRRLTQREMAVIIGLTRQKIADYEGGRSKISAEDWEKIQALSKKK